MKIKLILNNESQWASQVVRVVKNLRANTGDGRDRDACSILGSKKNPLELETATYSIILAWKIHEYRILVGYSPWVCKESDMTEHTCMDNKNS